MGAGLVLASSKTAAEIRPLQTAIDAATGIGLWPAIVENGAGILWPQEEPGSDARSYQKLRGILATLDDTHPGFRGFSDMTAQDVAERTSLTLDQAKLAKQRQFSEPGVWTGTPQALEPFQTDLAKHGVQARRGGRFLTLSFAHTKADAMASIIKTHRPQTTFALGDAPNDIEMIEAADRGVVVHNPHAKPLPPLRGEDAARIIRTKDSGPSGWSDAVLSLLNGLIDR